MMKSTPERVEFRNALRTVIEKTGDDEVLATFDQPQRAVTPGQAAVFYDRDLVVGGGWIV